MDTLLCGGRVVDPGTGTDEIADVHIRAGSIASVGHDLPIPDSAAVIDVRGLVVGPGFFDLHSHVHSIAGHRLQALDGVTTSLDLEAGLMPIARAYQEAAAAGRPLNYGFSASWGAARAQVLAGTAPDATLGTILDAFGNQKWQRSSSPKELSEWLGLLEGELAAGALGIGVLVGYAPYSDPAEFLAVAHLAADSGVPTYTHARELIEADPTTPVDGSEEVVRTAAETGAHMHHCHVNSTSRRHIDRVLDTLEHSRQEGSTVTVEAYPYGAASTGVGASFLDPERLSIWGVTPSNIILLPTGERLADERRLLEVRELDPGTPCIVEFLDESDSRERDLLSRALAFPDAIVASDATPLYWPDGTIERTTWPLPPGASTHPRTAGTFAKALRLMVRERAAWSWLEAFRRCSYLPARVLDEVTPAARAKGHLCVGADADIVVVDSEVISDAATYLDPVRPSSGVRHLLVDGTFVVRDSEVQPDALPGRPLRAQPH